MNQTSPCPYCGGIGHHVWSGGGMCPGLSNPNPPIVVTGSAAFEIAMLRALCRRAADALEEDHEVIKDFFSKTTVRDKFLSLIVELRKAAQ